MLGGPGVTVAFRFLLPLRRADRRADLFGVSTIVVQSAGREGGVVQRRHRGRLAAYSVVAARQKNMLPTCTTGLIPMSLSTSVRLQTHQQQDTSKNAYCDNSVRVTQQQQAEPAASVNKTTGSATLTAAAVAITAPPAASHPARC